jgi:hypothetical protein
LHQQKPALKIEELKAIIRKRQHLLIVTPVSLL